MKLIRTKFINSWYPTILTIYIVGQLITHLLRNSQEFGIAPYIQIGIVGMVIVSIIFNFFPHIIVRVAGLVILIGGCLGLLSTFLFLFSGDLNGQRILNSIAYIINFVIGFILYKYFDSSVADDEDDQSSAVKNDTPE